MHTVRTYAAFLLLVGAFVVLGSLLMPSASAATTTSHSVSEAQTKADAADGNPDAGMPALDEAVVTGDTSDTAAGLVLFGVPIVFAVGLCFL